MPVPTHSFSCYTKLFPASCPSCKEDVYYFSCTCGSKVFFDKVGWPWGEHECLEYRLERELNLLNNVDRMSADEIYNAIIKHERKSGEEVTDRIWEIVENSIGRRKSKLTITKHEPIDSKTEISGKIMEFNKPINIVKRLGYDANSNISLQLLGEIGKHEWAYLKVRTNADRLNQCLEFEMFIKVRQLTSNPLRTGQFILGIADKVIHLKGSFWELKSYRIM